MFHTFDMICAYRTTCNSIDKVVHLQPCAGDESGVVTQRISDTGPGVYWKLDDVRCKNFSDEILPEHPLVPTHQWVLSGITALFFHRKLCVNTRELDNTSTIRVSLLGFL